MRSDMVVLRTPDEILIVLPADPAGEVERHLSMYKIGRDADGHRARRPRRPLADRPADAGAARRCAARRREQAPDRARRRRRGARRDDVRRRRPDRDPGGARADRRRARARGRRRGRRGDRCDRPRRGRPAGLRGRDGQRDDPAGGGHQRARRQLREGLLRGPGDRRPPALQGQAEPAPAPAARRGAARGGRRRAPRRARARHDRNRGPLPRRRLAGARDPAPRGRAWGRGRNADDDRRRSRRSRLERATPIGRPRRQADRRRLAAVRRGRRRRSPRARS